MKELAVIYQERKERFEQTAAVLATKYNRFSMIRLLTFFGGAALIVLLWSVAGPLVALVGILLFLAGFARFVFWHQAIQHDQKHHERLATINTNELSFLANDYSVFEDGAEFVDPQHPYTVDMDIFGPYSFFQYCNRTSTAIGKQCLAAYLKNPVSKDEILLRQAAIQELTSKLDWRQHFQAEGMVTEDAAHHIVALQEWMAQEPALYGNKTIKAALYWVPICSFIGLVVAFVLPWFMAIPFLLPAGYFLRNTLEHINKTAHQTGQAAAIIAYYGKLIERIENGTFQSEKLRALQQKLHHKVSKASAQTKRLSYLIAQLNVRNNMFAIFLNVLGLWDLQWTWRLERWKATHRTALPAWFACLQEFEALLSLATAYANNSTWNMPTITDAPLVAGKAVGHPLIAPQKRVCNDFSIPTQGHIKLVTGSNMAGKSTLLRTVGLNVLLANIGSAVCAETFQTPLLQVYSSMRTQDALHESTSSFYAELKRLKLIIEAVDNQENIFFLMDEILKGTNSNDRHTGSKALIKQLIKSKGSGIIATHDLELGALEASYGGAIENWCMEVEVQDGELLFDYKLKKGVSQSFNATQLMKNMGIRI